MSHGTGHRVGGGNQTERRVPSAGISQGGENSPAQCEHRPGAETLETRALESRRQQGRLCGSAPRGDLSFLLQVLLKAGNSVTASLARGCTTPTSGSAVTRPARLPRGFLLCVSVSRLPLVRTMVILGQNLPGSRVT